MNKEFKNDLKELLIKHGYDKEDLEDYILDSISYNIFNTKPFKRIVKGVTSNKIANKGNIIYYTIEIDNTIYFTSNTVLDIDRKNNVYIVHDTIYDNEVPFDRVYKIETYDNYRHHNDRN